MYLKRERSISFTN